MRKYQTFEMADGEPPNRYRTIFRLIVLMALLLVSPLIYECGILTHGRWQGVLGRSQRVETPILNTITRHASEFRSQFGGVGTSAFRKIEWKPTTIVPIAFGFAAIAGWFLRRGT